MLKLASYLWRQYRKGAFATPMAVPIGTLIPPKLRSQGVDAVATWAKSIGLGALDLPADFSAGAEACRKHGLRIGSVSSPDDAGLISPDEGKRTKAVAQVREQIRAMAGAGARVLFLCLVPEDRTQKISDSLAIYRETFHAIAAELEAAGVRAVIEGWPGPSPH